MPRHHLSRGNRQPYHPGDGERLIRFSFQYLDTTHPSFDVGTRGGDYLRRLLARFRELSALRLREFYSSRSSTLRIHSIDFTDHRVGVAGFGIPGRPDADYSAWQFALSANEHGRVHGFVVDDTFFVRWLDPEHNLYAGTR